MTPLSPFRRHAEAQARFCDASEAPFTARLCRLLGAHIDPGSALGLRLDSWPRDPGTDALALRLTGGLHAAVLSGSAPELAACYPPDATGDDARLWAAIAPVLRTPAFLAYVDSAPQTNEVMRSAPLAAGLLAVAAETGLALSLLELGASAGLNLLPDRYRLELGGVLAGDPQSALVLAPRWGGAPPPDVPLRIASRAGVDLNPLDPSNPADRVRLLSYVWPDQPERLARMRAALAIAGQSAVQIDAGDAADFVERHAVPTAGMATVDAGAGAAAVCAGAGAEAEAAGADAAFCEVELLHPDSASARAEAETTPKKPMRNMVLTITVMTTVPELGGSLSFQVWQPRLDTRANVKPCATCSQRSPRFAALRRSTPNCAPRCTSAFTVGTPSASLS